ncbi:MAG: esterase family protein [Acidobacteriales bacterium]|nr:esterase family protein [Terriglobales bacterium]
MTRLSRCIFFLLLVAVSASADSRIECGALSSKTLGRNVRYCALLPPSYDSDKQKKFPVLYFLHGLGDNEQSLVNMGAWNVIENLRDEKKIGEFVIVTPEAGRSFYVNSFDGRTRYSDFFIREFMPAIERKYRARSEKAARAISGISMGGYGALRFAFAYPNLFSSVSAHSAALISQPVPKLNSAMSASTPMSALLGSVFGRPINAAHWRQNSPFVLARKNRAALTGVKIYFDCGLSDEYDFDAGARALRDELESLKIKHEAYLYPGNHGLRYFLEHLPASMEFHSQAFGAEK